MNFAEQSDQAPVTGSQYTGLLNIRTHHNNGYLLALCDALTLHVPNLFWGKRVFAFFQNHHCSLLFAKWIWTHFSFLFYISRSKNCKILQVRQVKSLRKWEPCIILRADSRLAPSQWETSLQSNPVSHWLGTNLESALILYIWKTILQQM